MYNRVILMGRICHDLELKNTPNGVPVLSFRIAVERNYQVKGEDRKTDFFNVVAWRSTAEFISRYFFKGRMILIDGELQTRQYVDKNNITQNIVEIIVDNASFTGEPKQQQQGGGSSYQNYQSYQNVQGGQANYQNPQASQGGGAQQGYRQQGAGAQSGFGGGFPAQQQAASPVMSQGSAQDFVDNTSADDDYPF